MSPQSSGSPVPGLGATRAHLGPLPTLRRLLGKTPWAQGAPTAWTWWFPESWGYPQLSSIFNGIVQNHPFLGIPSFDGNLDICPVAFLAWDFVVAAWHRKT